MARNSLSAVAFVGLRSLVTLDDLALEDKSDEYDLLRFLPRAMSKSNVGRKCSSRPMRM